MSCGPIQVIQQIQEITVCAQNPISQFQPFSFTALVDGQTQFGPLPQVPLAIVTLAITGTLQNPVAITPDYTLSGDGLTITLSEGIAAGNTVFGMYQVT